MYFFHLNAALNFCLKFSSVAKMFKFLNQCFALLRFWKSVSDSRNLLDGATAVLLETLFQNWSRAKHWFKNSNILIIYAYDLFTYCINQWSTQTMKFNTLLTSRRTIDQSPDLIQHGRAISNFMHETVCISTVCYFNFQSFTNRSDTTW